MIGEQFGYLTVIREAGKNKSRNTLYECLCVCGNKKLVPDTSLKLGRVKSCGCKKGELRLAAMQGEGLPITIDEKLTVEYIHKRIDELRGSIKHLEGKTPDVMDKVEWLTFYTVNSRIIELQELIGE